MVTSLVHPGSPDIILITVLEFVITLALLEVDHMARLKVDNALSFLDYNHKSTRFYS